MIVSNTYTNLKLNGKDFIKSNLEKVDRLIDILKFLNNDNFFKGKFALKGGTAINLTAVPLERLSVDIDLDLSNNLSKEETSILKKETYEKITDYMSNNGYNLSVSPRMSYALLSFQFYYTNAWGNKDKIKVEINFLDRAHILPLKSKPLLVAFDNKPFEVLSIDTIELYASKINALLDRATPRDLFDVNMMINKNIIDDQTLLRKCLVFYNMIGGNQDIDSLDYHNVKNIDYMMIKKQLRPLLDKKDKFNLDEAKENVINYLKALIKLDDDEIKFIKEFRQNNYDPSLLFKDDEIIKNIINHPMALWRCKNNIIHTETIDNIE